MDTIKIDVAQIPQTTSDFQDLRHLLAGLIRDLTATAVLEIGTDVGDSSRIFSSVLQETGGHLWTVDIQPPKGDWLTNWPLKNISFIQGDSRQLKFNQKIDLLFLDGDHTYETVRHELFTLGRAVRAGGKIACHDTLHSEFGPGIMRAIHEFSQLAKLPWTHYPYQHGLAVVEVTYELPALG